MGVTSTDRESDQNVASSALNFDLIKARAAEKLQIDVTEVTDQVLGDLIGMTRDSIGRLRRGTYRPALETVVELARALGTTMDALLSTPTGDAR